MSELFKNQPARKDNTRVGMNEDLRHLDSEKIIVDLSKIGAIPPGEKGRVSFEREMLQLTFRTDWIVQMHNWIRDKKLKIGKQVEGTVYEVNLDRLKRKFLEEGGSEGKIDRSFLLIPAPDFTKFNYWEKILREAKPEKK